MCVESSFEQGKSSHAINATATNVHKPVFPSQSTNHPITMKSTEKNKDNTRTQRWGTQVTKVGLAKSTIMPTTPEETKTGWIVAKQAAVVKATSKPVAPFWTPTKKVICMMITPTAISSTPETTWEEHATTRMIAKSSQTKKAKRMGLELCLKSSRFKRSEKPQSKPVTLTQVGHSTRVKQANKGKKNVRIPAKQWKRCEC